MILKKKFQIYTLFILNILINYKKYTSANAIYYLYKTF